jgi:AraC-like DNA-binding protein
VKNLLIDLQHSLAQAPAHQHAHLSCELVYVRRGRARFTIAGTDYTAGPGCLVFISSLEEHQVHVLAEPYERYFAILSLPELSRAFPHSPLTSVFRSRPQGFSHCVALRKEKSEADALFAHLCAEYGDSLPFGRQMVESLLGQLLVLAYRACPGNFAFSPTPAAQRILDAQQYIEAHFAEPLSVTDLATRFFISPCHLAHSFHAQVGYSPKQYIRLLRLSYARELLETTDYPVADIAARSGFSDVNNFIRAFRQSFGISPGQWRRKA